MQEISPTTTEPKLKVISATPSPSESVCPIDGSAESCSIQPPPSDQISIDAFTTVSLTALAIPALLIIFACIKLLIFRRDKAKVDASRTLIIRGLIGLLLVISIYLIILILAPKFGVNIQIPDYIFLNK